MEKLIDGQTYILKSHVDKIISERLQKVSTRAQTAEDRYKELEAQIKTQSEQIKHAETLNSKIAELQGELDKSQLRHSRYKTISAYGLQADDLVDHIEHEYNRHQSKLAKKDQVPLESWLDSIVKDPSQAPFILRPHLQGLATAPQADTQAQLATMQTPQAPQAPQAQANPPRVNMGVQRTPEPTDLIERAIKDPNFLAENRERVRQAWKNQAKNLFKR